MNTFVHGGDLPGIRQLAQALADANRSVLVGVPAGKIEPDGTTMALVAAVQEFGSPENNIPERPFLRMGIAAGRPRFERLNSGNLRLILAGRKTVTRALEELGNLAAGEVKRGMVTLKFEPLKPATIARKGSSRPLIDTGNLRQSITYQVEPASSGAKVIG
jgi:hypothetical protein